MELVRWLAGRLGPVVAGFKWVFALGKSYLPRAVAQVLAHPGMAHDLLMILFTVGQYANLTNEQRRSYALNEFETYLHNHHIDLPDREISLLLELVFGRLKTEHPEKLAPPPLDWTKKAGVGG
jgi:hypothetical protein